MIHITNRQDCCGCAACAQRCPKQCISMKEDAEGFLYPTVDTEVCIDCGLCEKVCPELNSGRERQPQKVYAAINKDEKIRLESSSGGVFTALAEQTIDEGGVVFGARFDENWEVVHAYTETKEGLTAFRGSKYVQSRIGNAYKDAERFLRNGRKVLFTGTPCLVMGLKLYLGRDYDNLLTVDFLCHGVPSPKAWRLYLKEEVARMCDKNSASSHPKSLIPERDAPIVGISFRDKHSGWKKYSFALILSKASAAGEKNTVSLSTLVENPYLRAFLANLSLRLSCYACPAKSGKSCSDITIGDFWGIARFKPEIDDDKGVSIVLDFAKGSVIEELNSVDIQPMNYEVSSVCGNFSHSSIYNGNRPLFFRHLGKRNIMRLFERYAYPCFFQRVMNVIERKLAQ